MTWWQALILGVVQGATEFLPISSSGHLALAEAIVGLRMPGLVVEVALHVATLVAVFIVYHRRLSGLVTGVLKGDRAAWRYTWLLVIGTLPAVVVGLLFKDLIEAAFNSLLEVGIEFVITGFILWSVRKPVAHATRVDLSAGDALIIGIAQAFAILPAISRSGTTVAAALWRGIAPAQAAEFSFVLSVPAIIGAAVLEIPDLRAAGEGLIGLPLALGFAAALLVGVVSILILVRMLQRGAFHRFAPYCWVLGAITIGWAVMGP
jgi:undecaprenyl-diphosphatase